MLVIFQRQHCSLLPAHVSKDPEANMIEKIWTPIFLNPFFGQLLPISHTGGLSNSLFAPANTMLEWHR